MLPADIPTTLQNRRIMIVEDDALAALAVEAALQNAGCTTFIVPELAAALLLAEQETIDIAFLNVSALGCDAFVVAERLAEKGIPFLFTTAHDSRTFPPRHRAQPVLYKPYAGDELLEAVSVVLDTYVLSARKPG